MKHDEARLLMSEYLDGRLSDDDVHRLNTHLRTCSSCLAYWKALQRVSQVFQTADMALPPPDFTQRLMRRLDTRAPRADIEEPPTPLAWAALAASVAVLAALAGFYILRLPTEAGNGPSLDIVSLSMYLSRAVLLMVRIATMGEIIIGGLTRSIPTPVLVISLLWITIGSLIMLYTVIRVIIAYQRPKTVRERIKDR